MRNASWWNRSPDSASAASLTTAAWHTVERTQWMEHGGWNTVVSAADGSGRGSVLRTGPVEPDQAEDREHHRHESVADAIDRPHRGARERDRIDDAERADREHTDQLDDHRDQRDPTRSWGATPEGEGGDDVDQCRERREQVGQRRLGEPGGDLYRGPGGRGKCEHAVDRDQCAAGPRIRALGG